MKNRHVLVLSALLGLLFSSCKKSDVSGDLKPSKLTASAKASTASLLPLTTTNPHLAYEETVEGVSPFSTARLLETGSLDYALNFVTNPFYEGLKSARFEIHKDQPLVNNGIRSQVDIVNGSLGDISREAWYSFACYFPSSDYEFDNEEECINEWSQNGVSCTSLCTGGNRLIFKCGGSVTNRDVYDLGSITKDKWCQFVFHFIHSCGSDGLCEVWCNGNRIVSRSGANMCNDVLPTWKIGLCKDFKDPGSRIVSRAICYDNIRCGKDDATYDDMCGVPPTSR
jgi:hypothetical protein